MDKLIKHLNDFNRKERFLLSQYVFSDNELRISKTFRDQLANVIKDPDINFEKESFVATDYHMDWIYASLVLSGGIDGNEKETKSGIIYDNKSKSIRANQQDIDLFTVFPSNNMTKIVYHFIMIEAKATTGWTGSQLESKGIRLREIFAERGKRRCESVKPHFILMSPRDEEYENAVLLNYDNREKQIPEWMLLPNQKENHTLFRHLKFTMPKVFTKVTRCDDNRKKDRQGGHWKVETLTF